MVQELYSNVKLKANPSDKEHVVNKKYVDDLISGKIKEAVRVVEGTNFDASYDGVAMTLTQTTAGVLVIDGVTVELNDRILLIGQTDATQNGIYTVTTLGDDAGTQAVLTRAEDFNSSSAIKSNVRIPVSQGTTNKDTSYVLTTDGAITLDTTPLEFARFSAKAGVDKAIGTFKGDGVLTEFTITHGLGTTKPSAVAFYKADNTPVGFGWKATSDNVITVTSDVLLEDADGEFTVVVTA